VAPKLLGIKVSGCHLVPVIVRAALMRLITWLHWSIDQQLQRDSNLDALGAGEVLRVAARLDCSPAQVVLAWALRAAPNILLIPGTASRAHLRENLDAAKMTLDAEAVRELSRL